MPITYLAPALEITTFLLNFLNGMCNYDGFIYLFIFSRLILHNNSKDKFRLKIKKIHVLGSSSASFMPLAVFSSAEMPHYCIWHPIVNTTVC